MKDVQLWNPMLYYLIWWVMIAASGGIAVNIWYWEKFVNGFKFRLASFIKYLATAFFLYNIGLVVLDYFQFIGGYWLWLHRAISITLIPFAAAAVMSFINFRARRVTPEEQDKIIETYEILVMMKKEQERGAKINKDAQAFIHNS